MQTHRLIISKRRTIQLKGNRHTIKQVTKTSLTKQVQRSLSLRQRKTFLLDVHTSNTLISTITTLNNLEQYKLPKIQALATSITRLGVKHHIPRHRHRHLLLPSRIQGTITFNGLTNHHTNPNPILQQVHHENILTLVQ